MAYNYDADRQQSLDKLRAVTESRQRFLDQIYAKMEAEEARRQQEAAAAESASNKNWLDEGMQGAALGGSVAGPWGALIGGIAGTAMGQKKAYDQRRKEGQGRFDSFTHTIFDTPMGSNKLTKENMTNGAAAYGSAKSAYDMKQAQQATAKSYQRGSAMPMGNLRQTDSTPIYSADNGGMAGTQQNQRLGGINSQWGESAPGSYDEQRRRQQRTGFDLG